jgi:uncharacterized protein (DUF983 family)
MPQVDLTSFHSLTLTTFFLIFLFFSFVFYYITPLWSTVLKLSVKKLLISFFLLKTTKNKLAKLFFNEKLLKVNRGQSYLL